MREILKPKSLSGLDLSRQDTELLDEPYSEKTRENMEPELIRRDTHLLFKVIEGTRKEIRQKVVRMQS